MKKRHKQRLERLILCSVLLFSLTPLVVLPGPVWAQEDDRPVVIVLEIEELEEFEELEETKETNTESPVLRLDEVVVTGTGTAQQRRDSPVPVDLISREEIELSSARTLAELLGSQPGVEITPGIGGAGIRLQGFDPAYTLILLNGQPLGGRIDGTVDLSRFQIEEIERVEILRGAGATLYGADALAGVINIITRESTAPLEGEATVAYGLRNALDITARAGMNRDRYSLQVSASHTGVDGYDLNPETAATTGSESRETTFNLGSTLRLGEAWELRLRGSYLYRNQHRVDAGASRAVFDRYNRFEDGQAQLQLERDLGDGVWQNQASFQVFRNQFLYDQRGSDALDRFEDSREQRFLARSRFETLLGNHLLSMGVEGGVHLLDAPRLREGQGRRVRGALFAQDEWFLDDAGRFAFVPGARLDLDSQFGLHPSLNLASRWRPVDPFTLRASVGRGYRAPSFQELLLEFENPAAGYLVAGNPDLQPETSWSYQAGGMYSPISTLDLELNLYWNEISDLITTGEFAPPGPGEPTLFGYRNIEQARTRGVESGLRFRPLSQIELNFSYTLTDTLNRDLGRPLEGRSPHRFTFGFQGRDLPFGLEAGARATFVGCRPFYGGLASAQTPQGGGPVEIPRCRLFEAQQEAPGVSLAPPHALLEARIGRDFGQYFHAFLRGQNLTNAGDLRFLPIPPRMIQLGLRGRY